MFWVKASFRADLIRDGLYRVERIWRRLSKPVFDFLIDQRSTTCAAPVRNTAQSGAAIDGM